MVAVMLVAPAIIYEPESVTPLVAVTVRLVAVLLPESHY